MSDAGMMSYKHEGLKNLEARKGLRASNIHSLVLLCDVTGRKNSIHIE